MLKQPSMQFAIINENGEIVETLPPSLTWREIRRKMIRRHFDEVLRQNPHLGRYDAYALVAEEWGLTLQSIRETIAGRR